MHKHLLIFLLSILATKIALAQDNPAITAWQRNTDAATGYQNIVTNIKSVHYSTNWAYISTNDIPTWIPNNVGVYPLTDWWPNNP